MSHVENIIALEHDFFTEMQNTFALPHAPCRSHMLDYDHHFDEKDFHKLETVLEHYFDVMLPLAEAEKITFADILNVILVEKGYITLDPGIYNIKGGKCQAAYRVTGTDIPYGEAIQEKPNYTQHMYLNAHGNVDGRSTRTLKDNGFTTVNSYDNGALHGKHIAIANNHPRIYGSYKNNKEHGAWLRLDDQGHLLSITQYDAENPQKYIKASFADNHLNMIEFHTPDHLGDHQKSQRINEDMARLRKELKNDDAARSNDALVKHLIAENPSYQKITFLYADNVNRLVQATHIATAAVIHAIPAPLNMIN